MNWLLVDVIFRITKKSLHINHQAWSGNISLIKEFF